MQHRADGTTAMPPPAPPPREPQPSPAELPRSDSRPQTRTRTEEPPLSSLRSHPPEKLTSSSSRGDGGSALVAVAVETYYSPSESPFPITPPADAAPPSNNTSLAITLGRVVREETSPSAGGAGKEKGGVFGGWKRKKKEDVVGEIVGRSKKKVFLVKAALGFRVYEFVFSLISFAVMATNSTQGWSGDSFYRYKEYRYCLSVNVIAFAYAAFQAYHLTYTMVSGKQFIKRHLQFDFLMDQILAYLLISASSAAASRVDDWQANWGKDEFTEKASASASMSFLAFVGFAASSLISGFNLCNGEYT